MGLYDTVIIDDSVELPEFPDNRDPSELEWQTKDIGRPFMRTFKITENGQLLRKEVNREEMTDEELDEYAQERGYESWQDWVDSDNEFGPLETWKYKVVAESWVNHNQHGSFEFYASTKRMDEYDRDIYWSYEARFTKGNLDKILLLDKDEI